MDAGNRRKDRDEEQDGAPSSDEEGIDLMNSEGDSSEEESDEDPEEEARIREGEACDLLRALQLPTVTEHPCLLKLM